MKERWISPKWVYTVVREAETMTLDEMFREVMEKERERVEDETRSIEWFGSYQDAISYFAV